jgi:hypothetical protein
MKEAGDFFAIDINAFSKACQLGANAAAAYLIMARGTGGDNRTTAWSAEAVQSRTGINWSAAKEAIGKLQAEGLVALKDNSTKRRPRYDLPPILPSRPRLGGVEKRVFKLVADGGQPARTRDQQHAAHTAAQKGYLQRSGSEWKIVAEPRPTLAWLPNSLVDSACGEVAPVERLRRRREAGAGALLLLADLYHHHDLANDSGIDRQFLWMSAERTRVARADEWDIWEFELDRTATVSTRRDSPFFRHFDRDANGYLSTDRFFDRLKLVDEAGLIEWVLYLVEGGEDDPEAGLIAPIGVLKSGSSSIDQRKGPEWWLRQHATRAAMCLIANHEQDDELEGRASVYEGSGTTTLVALERDYAEANLVGVARMRYRPRTAMTAAWHVERHEQCIEMACAYERIIRERRPNLWDFVYRDVEDDIKVGSM